MNRERVRALAKKLIRRGKVARLRELIDRYPGVIWDVPWSLNILHASEDVFVARV